MPDVIAASVVICTFNRKRWLEQCLEALLPQAGQAGGVEAIVVDGPSTDGTRPFLEKLESEGRLVLVRQPSLDGISAARNLGLKKARGEVICFIDDDAIIEPGWMNAILGPYEDATVGGVGGPVLDLQGNLVMGRNIVSKMGEWLEQGNGRGDQTGFPVMVGCNMSFRTSALRDAGGFDPLFRYHQDETDACLRVQFKGGQIRYAEAARVRHAWCEGSYRRDRMLWYLRLRYLWGRNDAYLVRKNFGGSVSFTRYLGHKVMRSLSRRHRAVSGTAASGVAAVPAPISMLGATLELSGAAWGWMR
jgi:GT2 family glycosyltransferase